MKKEHPARRWMKGKDFFAFVPYPRFVGESQGSVKGFTATVLVLGLMLGYSISAVLNFFSDPPRISEASLTVDDANYTFVEMAFVFRISDAYGSPTVFLYNDTVFTTLLRQTRTSEQDRLPRNIEWLSMVPCNVSSWGGFLGTNALCPSKRLVLRGMYFMPTYIFWQLDISPCVPGRTKLPGNASCHPDAPALLRQGRMNIIYRLTNIEGQEYFLTTQYYRATGLRQTIEQQWQVTKVVTRPNLIESFSTTEFTLLHLETEKNQILDSVFLPELNGSPEVTIFAHVGPQVKTIERFPQTILDLFGTIFAFFGALTAPLAFIFTRYNEKKFFRRHPAWDNIDGDFRVAADRNSKEMTQLQTYLAPEDEEAKATGPLKRSKW